MLYVEDVSIHDNRGTEPGATVTNGVLGGAIVFKSSDAARGATYLYIALHCGRYIAKLPKT